MTPNHQQAILKRLDERLNNVEWPLEVARLKEVVNTKRGIWPKELIDLIDEKFKQYEKEIK